MSNGDGYSRSSVNIVRGEGRNNNSGYRQVV
jgi:hypothetical protein